jgi:hypothetical protein
MVSGGKETVIKKDALIPVSDFAPIIDLLCHNRARNGRVYQLVWRTQPGSRRNPSRLAPQDH